MGSGTSTPNPSTLDRRLDDAADILTDRRAHTLAVEEMAAGGRSSLVEAGHLIADAFRKLADADRAFSGIGDAIAESLSLDARQDEALRDLRESLPRKQVTRRSVAA